MTKFTTKNRICALKPSKHHAGSSPDLGMPITPHTPYLTLARVLFRMVMVLWATQAVAAAPYAYIANINDTVSIVDTETDSLAGTIVLPIDSRPSRICINPVTPNAYTLNSGNNTVSVIDTNSNRVVATIFDPRFNALSGLACNPSGTHVYVANSDASKTAHEIYLIDTTTGTVLDPGVPVDRNPGEIVFNRDGSIGYVLNQGTPSISIMDTANRSVSKTILLDATDLPYLMAIHADDKYLYVSNKSSHRLDLLYPATGDRIGSVATGGFLTSLEASNRTNALYIADSLDAVSLLDPETGQVTKSFTARAPRALLERNDGQRLYVASDGDDTIQVLDARNLAATKTITLPAGSAPQALAVLRGSRHPLWVTAFGDGSGAVNWPIKFSYPDANAGGVMLPEEISTAIAGSATSCSTIDWTGCDGVTARGTESASCLLNPLNAARTVSVVFTAKRSYDIVAAVPGGNGTVNCPTSACSGDSPVCSIVASPGYHLSTLTDNGANVPGARVTTIGYQVANAIANRSVVATFAKNQFSVTVTPGANGNITGPTIVYHGDKPTYTVTPDVGYRIADVIVDAVSVGVVSSFSFDSGITAPASISASFSIIPTDGFAADYPFSGGASDASGNGHGGAVNAAVLTADRFNMADSAYRFDGAGASIEVAAPPGYFTGDFAISFWEKVAGPVSKRMHALSLGDTALDNLDFDFNDQYGLWVYWNGAGGNAIGVGQAGEFTDGAWHQVVFQRRGTQVQLIVDGVLRGSAVYTDPIGSRALMRIGRGSAADTDPSSAQAYWWDGSIDDVRIYSAALDQEMDSPAIDGLSAYYPFSGGALDASGNGHGGSVNAAVLTADRFNVADSAYQFDGAGASIEVAAPPGYFTGDFAISFWERAAGPAGKRMHALSLGHAALDNLDFDFDDQYGLWVYWNGGGGNAIGVGQAGEFTDGAWHQVVFQRTGTQVQLIIDGVLRGSAVYTDPIGSGALMRIGRGSAADTDPASAQAYWWDGTIDDVRIYGRALTNEHIGALVYQWKRIKPSSPTQYLAAYYPFSGGASDASGNGHGGSVNAAVLTADRFNVADSAYQFDGAGASIEVAAPPGYFTGDFAISFWEKVAGPVSKRMHALSLGDTALDNLDFDFNDQYGLWVYWNGGGGNAIGVGQAGEFTDGAWHQVVFQRRGTQVQLIIDGVLRGSAAYADPIGSQALMRIGRGSAADTDPASAQANWWNGAIDDVRIYGRALTNDEVALLQREQFSRRDGAGALTFAGKMWLLGGWSPYSSPASNSEVWQSTDGADWSLASVAPWEGRHLAGYLVFNNKMWILGGDNNSCHYQNEVWSSSDGIAWNLETSNVPWSDRVTHYALVYDDKMWVMGGQQINVDSCMNGSATYNDVYSSTDGTSWVKVTDHAGWSPRGQISGSVVFDGKMWVIGGGTYNSPRSYLNDVWSSTDGKNWELVLEQAPWIPRQFHSVAVFDNKIWVLGGSNGGNPISPHLDDVWYSSDGKNWNRLPYVPWTGRHASSVFAFDNALWVVGGSSNPSSTPSDDVWKLTYGP